MATRGRKPYPLSKRACAALANYARSTVIRIDQLPGDSRPPKGPPSYQEIARHLRQRRLTAELVDKRVIRRACIRLGVRS